MVARSEDVTRLLDEVSAGRPGAWQRLLTVVYRELRKMAHTAMSQEGPGRTLQTTALVNEAWLRLAQHRSAWQNREHFFTAAGHAMGRILVDEARRRRTAKRGKGSRPVSLDDLNGLGMRVAPSADLADDLEALLRAFEKLAALSVHKAKASVFALRHFVGMTAEETAQALDLSLATVSRHSAFATAWISREVSRERATGD
ncbi:MAG: ECF-type sigma factor [Planctomycetota bacterium]